MIGKAKSQGALAGFVLLLGAAFEVGPLLAQSGDEKQTDPLAQFFLKIEFGDSIVVVWPTPVS